MSVLDRRGVMLGVGAAGLAGLASGLHAQPIDQDVSLGATARAVDIAFGTAFDREILTDVPYRALVARESRIATIENSMKFDWLRPRGPQADFAVTDQLVDFAQRNAIALRGHPLVWNDWPPPWLTRMNRREIAGVMDRHIDEVAGRYRGRMHSWDVVNEPFFPLHRQPGGFRRGPWLEAMGKDYIARAFRRAAAADPGTKLVLNEAFCEQNDDWGNAIRPLLLRQIDEMKDADVPLHAVGFQAHLKPHLPYDDAQFQAYLVEVARRGVDIYITELDVDDSGMPDDPARRDEMVARRHFDFLRHVLAVPQVKVVVTWHLADKYSWYGTARWYGEEVGKRGGNPRRRPRTHIHDDELRPKAARAAVQRALLTRVRRP